MARDWERKDDHERRQRAEAIGRLIEAERAVVDAENELRQLQLQVIAMFLPQLPTPAERGREKPQHATQATDTHR